MATNDKIRNLIRNILFERYCMLEGKAIDSEQDIKDEIELLKRGSQTAASRIVDRYQNPLFYFLLKKVNNREDAEDLVSMTFEKALRNINQYDSSKGAFSTWLYNVATNLATDLYRSKEAQKRPKTVGLIGKSNDDDDNSEFDISDTEANTNFHDRAANPEQEMMKSQKYEAVRNAIERLDPKYGNILKMFYFEGLKLDEIAERLQMPLNTVKVNLFRAKEELSGELKYKDVSLSENITINEVRDVIKKTSLLLKEYSEPVLAPEKTQEPTVSDSAIEDKNLISRIKEGDEKAMQKIMTKYQSKLRDFVLKKIHNTTDVKRSRSQMMEDEADDIVMITFEKAFRNIDKYDPSYAFSTWLYRIAQNTSIDSLRKNKNNPSVSYHQPNEDGESRETRIADNSPDAAQELMKKEKYKAIRDGIEKMNPKYGQFLKMQYFDGLSYDEIAKKTKLPLQTVKTNVFRAKQQLSNELKNSNFSLNEDKK